ncbi:hypothetical protein [Absidia glauca]|uniref:Uncharacterized protein n=1 Tax=Absidia glauca TaxID=4829 RepID=A0A168PEF9_ABSGL|nr:hypothetical protein [Absidia glauca]
MESAKDRRCQRTTTLIIWDLKTSEKKKTEREEKGESLTTSWASATLDECSVFDSANMFDRFLIQARVNSVHSVGARTANSGAKKGESVSLSFLSPMGTRVSTFCRTKKDIALVRLAPALIQGQNPERPYFLTIFRCHNIECPVFQN